MTTQKIRIQLPDSDKRQASALIKSLDIELKKSLSDYDQEAELNLEKEDPNSQDIGTILAIILGAKATVAIAIGIANWMNRNNQTEFTVTNADGDTISIKNAESKHIEGALKSIYLKKSTD